MVRKVFVLASATALSGFVAAASGCTVTNTNDTTPDGGGGGNNTNTKTDSGSSTTTDAGGSTTNDSGGTSNGLLVEPEKLECAAKGTAIDATKFDYRPPTHTAGACTKTDVDGLNAFIDTHEDATFEDLRAESTAKSSKACTACVFAEASDKWAPIPTVGTKVLTLNISGCIEIVSGKGAACGKAHRQWDQCIDQACGACDDATKPTCSTEAQTNRCSEASKALAAACGADTNTYLQTCKAGNGIEPLIAKQCVE
jgi:hypothetical protein